MRHFVFFLISLLLILSACNVFVEKRRYNKGYHVQWNKKKRVTKSDEKEALRSDSDQTLRSDEIVRNESHQSTIENSVIEISPISSSKNAENEIADTEQNTAAVKNDVVSKDFVQSSKKYSSERISVSKWTREARSNNEQNNSWLYGLLAGMFATTFSFIRLLRKQSMRISRWANRNKKVTRGAIFAGQVGIGILGFYVGKSFGQMGSEFTTGSQYVLGGTFLLGSGLLYHLESKGIGFATWKSFFSNRLGHLIAGVSLFGMMMGTGNAFQHDNEQISVVGNVVTYVAGDNIPNDDGVTVQMEEGRNSQPSAGAVIGAIFVAILILGLTAVAACAAACNEQGLLALGIVLLGIALTVLAVRAITRSRY